GTVEPVALAFDHVAWQIDMLGCGSERRDEAYRWTWGLIDALEEPALAERAERALRSSGTVGEHVVGAATWELPPARTALRRRCWLLLADVATASSTAYLLGGPRSDDGDVRAATAAAIERATGVASGRDAGFWRDAPHAERFDVLRRWEVELAPFLRD